MIPSHRSPSGVVVVLAASLSLLLGACGKDPEPAPSGHGASPSSTGSGSTEVDAVRAELRSEFAEAKEHVEAKHLGALHEPAAHIWNLAARLRAAKAPYGRLFRLARDLDAQGDAGNAGGVAEVMAALEKEIASPSSPDVPDDGPPLAAGERH